MSTERTVIDPVENDLSVRYEANGSQTLVVVDGDRVGGVLALDQDVAVDDAIDFVDSIEAEIAYFVPGVRSDRESSMSVVDGGSHE